MKCLLSRSPLVFSVACELLTVASIPTWQITCHRFRKGKERAWFRRRSSSVLPEITGTFASFCLTSDRWKWNYKTVNNQKACVDGDCWVSTLTCYGPPWTRWPVCPGGLWGERRTWRQASGHLFVPNTIPNVHRSRLGPFKVLWHVLPTLTA